MKLWCPSGEGRGRVTKYIAKSLFRRSITRRSVGSSPPPCQTFEDLGVRQYILTLRVQDGEVEIYDHAARLSCAGLITRTGRSRNSMSPGNRAFTVILSLQDDGGYSVVCPALPGCVSQGDDRREALENIRAAIELVLEAVEEEAGVEDGFGPRSLSVALPREETPELIADEIRHILTDRAEDGLPYEGVSIERVGLSAKALV